MLNTLDEWRSYIDQLAGPKLRSKVLAANSQAFVAQLLDEGHDMTFVTNIMRLLVRQLLRTQTLVPEGGAFDLVDISETDPFVLAAAVFPGEVIDDMIESPPEEPPDELDLLVAEADAIDLGEQWGAPL